MGFERFYLTFIHTPLFVRSTEGWFDEDSLCALERTLIEQPEAGDLIQGTGGVRKVRVAVAGRGKRGGGRVIYLYRASRERIYLLVGYAKNVKADLTPADKRVIKHLVSQLEEEL